MCTSLNIKVRGKSESLDPVVFIIPEPYRPLVAHRLSGYGELDLIINIGGQIQVGCLPGTFIGGSDGTIFTETGLTFIHTL